MKKVLSLMLAIAMMLTAVPMAFAEEAETETPAAVTITEAGTTSIELSDYATFAHTAQSTGAVTEKVLEPKTNTLPDGTEVSFIATTYIATGTMTMTVPIHVEKAGRYKIETLYAEAGHLSEPIIKIGDTQLQSPYNRTVMDTEVTSEEGEKTTLYYFNDKNLFSAIRVNMDVVLPAGDQDLTVTFDMSNTNNGALAFAADYISFTKFEDVPTVDIATEGTTKIELENYKDSVTHANSMTGIGGSTALNGKLLALTEMLPGSDLEVKIPVDIKESGFYDLETVMSIGNSNWMTYAYISTDSGKTVLNNISGSNSAIRENLSVAEDGSAYFNKDYAAYRFGNHVFLEAGQQNITLLLKQRKQDNRICWMGDYISLTPVATKTIEISENEAIRLEIEDYADAFDAASKLYNGENSPTNQASGGAYLMWDTDAREDDVFGNLKINVAKSGFYNVTLIGSHVSASVASLYIGGKSVLSTTGNIETEVKGEDGKYPIYANPHFAAKIGSNRIFLAEGEQWIQIGICKRTITEGGLTFQDVAGCLDYLEFVPEQYPEGVVGAGETVIELEDYKDYVALDRVETLACSIQEHEMGTALNVTEKRAADGGYIEIPFTVEEAGIYNLSMIASRHTENWVSGAILYLDGKEVLSNENAYLIQDLSQNADGEYVYFNKSYQMCLFGTKVYLSAGKHSFTYYMKKRINFVATDESQVIDNENGIGRICHMVDCIKLEKLENVATYDAAGDTASAKVYAEKAVTGKVAAAFYNGNKLVGLAIADAENTDVLAVEDVICYEKPDNVKFLVWNDVESMVPVMAPITINDVK